MDEYIVELSYDPVYDCIESQDIVKEEIIRCMDCAYSFDGGSRCRKWRGQDCFENSVPEHVEPDGFCAWGERREE